MKRIVSKILALALVFGLSQSVSARPGDIAGNVYSTDIVTYMYYAPITSYNIGGKTCIDAEILNWHYGFDVYWHGDTRRLEITDKGGRFVSLQAMSGEIVESTSDALGRVVGNYYETDIVTTLNGREIESYNIGGRTVICAEAMADFGYDVKWDPDARTLTISKPMDFYTYESDFGNVKSIQDNSVVRPYNIFQKRGVIVTEDGKEYMADIPSGKVYVSPMGNTSIKLTDLAALLGGEVKMTEQVQNNTTSWGNGITDTYDTYKYVFTLNYDAAVKPTLGEYNSETISTEQLPSALGFIVDLPVNTLVVNGSETAIMSFYGGKEFEAGLQVIEGEIYVPTYSVAQLLGYDHAW